MTDIIQIAILICSGASIWAFAGTKYKRLGFVFGLCGQPFWIYTTFAAGQWGMFAVSLWFTGNHVRGLVNHCKQGTISVLAGCHSPIHSLLVVLAWKHVHGAWPRPWQVVCIFLHDIGHWGMDYLDDYEQKRTHWKLGARIAKRLFGAKGYALTAGHCSHSGEPASDLYRADKYSWHLAPRWWLYSNTFFEPKLRMGYGRMEAVDRFKAQVRESVESGEFRSTHSMYMERCK